MLLQPFFSLLKKNSVKKFTELLHNFLPYKKVKLVRESRIVETVWRELETSKLQRDYSTISPFGIIRKINQNIESKMVHQNVNRPFP